MIFGKHINRYYIKYFPIMLLGVIALAAVDYFQLIVPELYRMTIDGVKNGVVVTDGVTAVFNMDFLLDKICWPLILVLVVMGVGRFLWRFCFYGTAIRVETDIRRRMFDRAKDLSQSYYQEHKVGSIMSLFTNDLATVQDCYGNGILMFLDAFMLGGMAFIKMWRMSRTMTLLLLIPMALLLIICIFVGRNVKSKWRIRQQALSDITDFSQESFMGLAVIKAFVNEVRELYAFRKLNRQNEESSVNYTRVSTIMTILVSLLCESVVVIVICYGGYLVHNDAINFSASQLVEYLTYFWSITWPIMAVSRLIDMSSRGKASMNRISELLDAEVDVCDRKNVRDLVDVKGEIEFCNLSFTYPGNERKVLDNISFKINAGERVGIVGHTGIGKTTIVDLILRTHNVEDGTLLIDGQDVNDLSIKSVRAACAYVPQDNYLFSDTVANNISFGVDHATLDEIMHVAELADVNGNIQTFTHKYNTVMGERGVTVSGGQKQRISIARALLKNAPILILDDSVSAVDTKTEKKILQNLSTERSGMTTLMIAHRISTVESLDKIIFLESESSAVVGTHDQLYNTNTAYREMVDLQKLEEGGNGNA